MLSDMMQYHQENINLLYPKIWDFMDITVTKQATQIHETKSI
jgi:hypothetical protein